MVLKLLVSVKRCQVIFYLHFMFIPPFISLLLTAGTFIRDISSVVCAKWSLHVAYICDDFLNHFELMCQTFVSCNAFYC